MSVETGPGVAARGLLAGRDRVRTPRHPRLLRDVLAGLVILAFAGWGVRVNLLEGFIYEWPRHFRGDFYNAMFVSWDGTGIYYGPVFVLERWLVDLAPQVFNEYFFGVLNVFLTVAAFATAALAARLSWRLATIAAAAWLCFHWLTYSFSVSANPEFVELLLLCLAWYLAVSTRPSLGLAATAAATLTKRIPALFAPLLLMLEWSWRSLAQAAGITVVITAVVAIGQRMNPLDVLQATFPFQLPLKQVGAGGYQPQIHDEVTVLLAQPFPYPSQELSLSNALARLTHRPMSDWSLPFFQGFYYVFTAGVVLVALYVAWALIRGPRRVERELAATLCFAIFFALLPLAAITTHPHTFLFMLPVWTALLALIARSQGATRAYLALVGGIGFLFAGFPAAVSPVDRLLHAHLDMSPLFQDPILIDVAVIAGLIAYATALVYRPRTIG
ncbi:MAG TPA: hypothetical protein VF134_08020 [Candidatus Dormibacteraeota bacterium]